MLGKNLLPTKQSTYHIPKYPAGNGVCDFYVKA